MAKDRKSDPSPALGSGAPSDNGDGGQRNSVRSALTTDPSAMLTSATGIPRRDSDRMILTTMPLRHCPSCSTLHVLPARKRDPSASCNCGAGASGAGTAVPPHAYSDLSSVVIRAVMTRSNVVRGILTSSPALMRNCSSGAKATPRSRVHV